MNPKVSHLDPKLQEAYNRVMGTNINPQPAKPAQNEAPQPSPPSSGNQAFHNPVLTAKKAFVKPQGKSRLSPILVTLILVIFFLIYAAVWIKMFNLKVPFINP